MSNQSDDSNHREIEIIFTRKKSIQYRICSDLTYLIFDKYRHIRIAIDKVSHQSQWPPGLVATARWVP